MNTSAAYGVYSCETELQQVMHTLNQSGFDKRDICMMVSPRHPIATCVREANILNAERKVGAVKEGFIGWLFEFGAVVIPTVGFFVRSQAFLHALVTKRDSWLMCGTSGALVGLGFSEREAKRFEHQFRDFGVLVYVACPEVAHAEWAVEVLRRTGATEPALLGQEAFLQAAC
jgi:hypothetical protein